MKQSVELFGVLNVTPDSFSDGGKFFDPEKAIVRATQLLNEGASVIDIGGQSTRPGADRVPVDEEWRRIEPVLNHLLPLMPDTISVDTFYPEIIERTLQIGRCIVNDVTALSNPAMRELVASHKLRTIISHLPEHVAGDIMLAHAGKPVDNVQQVKDELLARSEQLQALGLPKELITLDPGIGFGKTMRLNWLLLDFAREVPDYPVMIGHSNKRFLKTVQHTGEPIPALSEFSNDEMDEFMDERNRIAASIAISAGAKYLRVHKPNLYQDLVA